MSLKEKIGFIAVVLVLGGIAGFLFRSESPSPSLGSALYTPTYSLSTTNTSASTTLFAFAGTLHTLVITAPVSNSVIGVYDSASTSTASAKFTVTIPSSTAQVPLTLTFDAQFSNGLTIAQTGASSTIVATYQQN